MLITELPPSEDRQSDHPRTVIIGGGTVGLYAARELSRRGHAVLVIESGGLQLDGFPPEAFSSIGKPHEGISVGRSRSLGGTSNLWGGQLVEFQPIDFEGRDWLPESRWPIGYDEVSRHYQPTYANLGMGGAFQADGQVFERVAGSRPELGHGVEVFLTRWMKTPSTARLYDKDIHTDRNLRVLVSHTVVGFRGSNGSIAGVLVRDRAGRTHTIPGDQFILAAGTIEACRLLLHAAASGEWDCPWRDNKNVGAYFQDHVCGRAASLHPLDKRRFFHIFSTIVWGGQKYQPKLRLRNEELARERILNIQASLIFESSISENLVYLKQFLKAAIQSRKISGAGDLLANVKACRKHLLPLMWRYVVQNRIFVPGDSKITLGIQGEQTPLRESRLTVDPSVRDACGLPKVVLDWKVGTEELGSIQQFTSRCQAALRAAGLAEVKVDEQLASGDAGFLNKLRDNYHQAGGTRMGYSERDGVVDRNLMVFGTRNLFITGASVFRTTSNANTTFTALALTTRLVNHLLSQPMSAAPKL